MRRSGFARKVYAPPVAPLVPVVGCTAVMARSQGVLASVPKLELLRSESYRKWVSILPCCACGIEGWTQVAHSNQAKHGHGRSIKAGDQYTFPMCCTRPGHMGCHALHDLRLDGLSKAERDALEDDYIAKTQHMAREAGRRELEAV